MPYVSEWRDPERLMRYRGVNIWCTYKDDDCENNPPSDNYFTFYRGDGSDIIDNSTGDYDAFDVRELPLYKKIVESARPPFLSTTEGDHVTKEVLRLRQILWSTWRGEAPNYAGVEQGLVKELVRQSLDRGDLKVPKRMKEQLKPLKEKQKAPKKK